MTVEGGEALLFASPEALDGPAFIRRLAGDGITVTEVSDPARGIYRAAAFRGDRLEAVCFLGPGARPAYPVVAGLFAKDVLDAATRKALLAGRSADGLPDPGPTVCACFSVGLNAVKDAIAGGAADVDAVGKTTRAGTNCGSCRSEIRRILLDATRLETA